MNKAQFERIVFGEFAVAAEIEVEPGSVSSEDPPLPDISCRVNGKTWLFELTRISDEKMANDIGYLLSGKGKPDSDSGVRVNSYCDIQSVEGTIAKKANIRHETKGCRFDLLLYIDGIFYPRVELNFVRNTLELLEKKYKNKWDTIWVYDRPKGDVLWPERRDHE